MSEYKFKYTGTVEAEWEYNGKHYEARMYDDGFGYIVENEDGYLSPVGNTGYDYFFITWLPLAQRLGVHE